MIIYNALIYPMSGQKPFKGWVEFEEKITKIGEGEYPQSEYSSNEINTKTLNAGGKILLPGFIDPHTHLGIVEGGISFEGDDCNESTDPFTPHLRVIDGINPFDRYFKEALAQGITTVAVAPGSANVCGGDVVAIKTRGSFVDEMLIKQVGIKFALGENPKSTYNDRSETPITRPAMTAIIREGLNKAKRYLESVEKYNENPDENDLPEYDAKCEGLLPLLRGEISAHFHAHRADDICTAIRICREFGLKLVLIHATEGYLIGDIIKKSAYFDIDSKNLENNGNNKQNGGAGAEKRKKSATSENVQYCENGGAGAEKGKKFATSEYVQYCENGGVGAEIPCTGGVVGVVTGPLLCDCSKPELANQDLKNTAVLFENLSENFEENLNGNANGKAVENSAQFLKNTEISAQKTAENSAKFLKNTEISAPKTAENSAQSLKNNENSCSNNIPVAICTDHPETPIGFLPVTVGGAMRGGLAFENALRAVTINAARILGIESRVGSIEVGKDADFQLYDSKNIFDIFSAPIAICVNGKFW